LNLDHEALRPEIARVSRRMSDSGLVAGTEGNVSARTSEQMAEVSAKIYDYGQSKPSSTGTE
jgi:ribulose-5-phosphate 4-epimerase/fuculose-1-phosphate aldolase